MLAFGSLSSTLGGLPIGNPPAGTARPTILHLEKSSPAAISARSQRTI
ncbi:hypothetical protein [Ornatilinea apprima]|nr:hypothetical protein [Ornatilinea apprima]